MQITDQTGENTLLNFEVFFYESLWASGDYLLNAY